MIWYHEPWRDEMQCWEIARQSSSLAEMFFNARYEGHPSGWYLLLFAITRVSDSFMAVQWLHWLIALSSVALVLWRSPFGSWQKTLLVFGYFFLFEYGILARNYAMGVLIALAICHLAQDWRRHWLAIHTLLFCLLQCNVFALFLAVALFAPLFFLGIQGVRKGILGWKTMALGATIFLSGLLLSIWDMIPPADTNYAIAWKWSYPDWKPALGAFFRAMLPISPWELHGWNSHLLFKWLDGDKLVATMCILSLLLLACCVFSLRKSPFALAFFGLAWAAVSVFLAVKFPGYSRHHGHFYLAWIMAVWLKAMGPCKKPSCSTYDRFPAGFFNFILVAQLVAVAPMAYFDIRFPFSQSKAVADFIVQNHLEDRFLVGDYDYATSPVAFHLRRPIYYPNQLKSGTYLLWNTEQASLKYDDIVPIAMGLCGQHGDLLLLTSYAIPMEKLVPSMQLIKVFAPAMEVSEAYYLYEIKSVN